MNVIIYFWNILLVLVDTKKLFFQRLYRDLLTHQCLEAPVYTTEKQTENSGSRTKKKTNPTPCTENCTFSSLEFPKIPAAQFSFPHSFPSTSFPGVLSNNGLISGGLTLQDTPSARGLGENEQRLQGDLSLAANQPGPVCISASIMHIWYNIGKCIVLACDRPM